MGLGKAYRGPGFGLKGLQGLAPFAEDCKFRRGLVLGLKWLD